LLICAFPQTHQGRFCFPVDPIDQRIGAEETRSPAPSHRGFSSSVGSPAFYGRTFLMLVILIHQKGRGLKRLMRHSSRPVFMRSGDGTAFADARSDIGHSLTAHARDVAGNFRRRLYEEVAQGTRDCHIVRAEGDPNALLGVIVLVDRVVAPPSAISVGRLGDPSRGLGCCSRCCGWDCDFYFSRLHLNKWGGTSAVLGP
jgi:hypothetical protein